MIFNVDEERSRIQLFKMGAVRAEQCHSMSFWFTLRGEGSLRAFRRPAQEILLWTFGLLDAILTRKPYAKTPQTPGLRFSRYRRGLARGVLGLPYDGLQPWFQ